jgi:membrane protein required for colicin V production
VNWVDWLIIAFLFFSIVTGFAEGLIKMGIGVVALIAGFLFASWFYGIPGGALEPWLPSRALASLIGFFAIFIGTMIAGALLAWMIQRIFKVIGLNWLDRIAGGAFGVVRGVLVLAVAALVFTAFFPRRMPVDVSRSQLAPYLFGASSMLAAATPFEIKDGFKRSYNEITALFDELKKAKGGHR